MLPDDDGLEIARDLRAHSDMAIIILTGKNSVIDRVVGLEIGADDYIVKPFDNREFLARVRSVLRRTSSAEGAPKGSRVVCTLTGHDSTYAQTIHSRNVYYPEDLAFGARLVDVISDLPDGRLMVDYDHFHDVVADEEVLRQLREAAEAEEAAEDSEPVA